VVKKKEEKRNEEVAMTNNRKSPSPVLQTDAATRRLARLNGAIHRTLLTNGVRRLRKMGLSHCTLLIVLSSMSASFTFADLPLYTVTDLGSLPEGFDHSIARDINNAGQIVGYSGWRVDSYPFIWDHGVMTKLSGTNAYAFAINDTGQVVGTSPAREAFLWKNGVPDKLNLPYGWPHGFASDINNAGLIVGAYLSSSCRACLWEDGQISDLGILSGGYTSSFANSINDAHQIVGYASEEGPFNTLKPRACLWENGYIIDLGDLPGGNDESIAFGLNDTGQVVGYSDASTGRRAFLWEDGVMVDLGDLPGGSNWSEARDINESGQIVGQSEGVVGLRAFLWDDGVVIDLNDYLDVSGTDWSLSYAYAINDSARIVGAGINPDGKTHAFLLIPVPEPSALALMILGVITVRRRDRYAANYQND